MALTLANIEEYFNQPPPLLYHCCGCGVLVDVRRGGKAHSLQLDDGMHMFCGVCVEEVHAQLLAGNTKVHHHHVAIDLLPRKRRRGKVKRRW